MLFDERAAVNAHNLQAWKSSLQHFGGAGIIRACIENATVPCIQTGTGICHIYVDKAADLDMALDIVDNRNWKLDESQADMPTQQWLMENSWRYGWILRYPNEKSAITGIIYEPWHYRYVGKTIAKEIYDLGICLEEYLQKLSNSVG